MLIALGVCAVVAAVLAWEVAASSLDPRWPPADADGRRLG